MQKNWLLSNVQIGNNGIRKMYMQSKIDSFLSFLPDGKAKRGYAGQPGAVLTKDEWDILFIAILSRKPPYLNYLNKQERSLLNTHKNVC